MTEDITKEIESVPVPQEHEEETSADTDASAQDAEKDEKTDASDGYPAAVNYEQIAKNDLAELKALFPALSNLTSITQLENPLRYAALRDLGLSAKEAYLATTEIRTPYYDNRAHLSSAVPGMASAAKDDMTSAQLADARMIFHDLSDREIQRLYKKVTSK
jgi:hypothetical protein